MGIKKSSLLKQKNIFKTLKILRYLIKKKIVFKKLPKVDILLLDNNYANLRFDGLSSTIIDFDEINLKCIIAFIKNFIFLFYKKLTIKEIYFKTLIESYNPKIAIGHSITGYAYICKKLCKKITTITYQHSFIYENEKSDYTKRFKNNECDYFISFDQMHTKFFSNLINANFLEFGSVKNNEIFYKEQEKIYPIMFISEFRQFEESQHFSAQKKAVSYLKNFCEIKKIRPQIALNTTRPDKHKYFGRGYKFENEIRFYREGLINFGFNKNSSYEIASKSNLIICLSSNLGIELLTRGFKVIFLNILGTLDKDWSHPYFSEEIPPFFIKDINSKNVYEKINFFLNLEDKAWKAMLLKNKNKPLFDEQNKLLKNKIYSIIEKKEI